MGSGSSEGRGCPERTEKGKTITGETARREGEGGVARKKVKRGASGIVSVCKKLGYRMKKSSWAEKGRKDEQLWRRGSHANTTERTQPPSQRLRGPSCGLVSLRDLGMRGLAHKTGKEKAVGPERREVVSKT